MEFAPNWKSKLYIQSVMTFNDIRVSLFFHVLAWFLVIVSYFNQIPIKVSGKFFLNYSYYIILHVTIWNERDCACMYLSVHVCLLGAWDGIGSPGLGLQMVLSQPPCRCGKRASGLTTEPSRQTVELYLK